MVDFSPNALFGYFVILLPVVPFYLSIRVYQMNRLPAGFLFVPIGLGVTLVRRLFGYAIEYGLFTEIRSTLQIVDTFLVLIIVSCYAYGFWSMKKSFENFDVIKRRDRA